jgi:osmotically-inducible protein OsmY
MRRIVLGLAITLAAIAPTMTFADDHQIAKSIAEALKSQKDAGNLRGFKINLQVDQGTVWLKGHVGDDEQLALAVRIANATDGVEQVVNDLSVTDVTPAPRKFNLSRLSPLRILKSQSQDKDADQSASAPVAVSTRRQTQEPVPAVLQPEPTVLPVSYDEEIAKAIFTRLSHAKQTGTLRNFKLDMNVENGTVWLDGHVTTARHKELALDIASRTRGVVQVVDKIAVQTTIVPVIPASNPSSRRAPITTAPRPVAAPIYRPTPFLQATVHAQATTHLQPVIQQLQPVIQQLQPVVQQVQPMQAQPVPMQMMGYPSYGTGIAAARYDHPHLPQYAWPSYAAYPNYGAVTYPQQYSASAWPYIGPFYPYPQVPLGWRKVELKWKDGWWMLDFKSK